jgi:hypothetical protein
MCSRQCPIVKMRTSNGLSIKRELHIFVTIQGPHQFMSDTGGVGANTSLLPLKWARNDSKTCNLDANIATELISTTEGERAVSSSVCYVYTGRVKQLCCPHTYSGELGKDNILRCLASIIKNSRDHQDSECTWSHRSPAVDLDACIQLQISTSKYLDDGRHNLKTPTLTHYTRC